MTTNMTGQEMIVTCHISDMFQRIERAYAGPLTEELKAGRLRQGWSNGHDLDLRTISAARERGEQLSEGQKQLLLEGKPSITYNGAGRREARGLYQRNTANDT